MARLSVRKVFVFGLCLSAAVFLLITLQVVVELSHIERTVYQRSGGGGGRQEWTQDHVIPPSDVRRPVESDGQYPLIVWWSPLTGEVGRLGECGNGGSNKCFFTINRTYYSHPSTHAFLFYGTDFNVESLPLPRKPGHQWALFHEESPKNNYKLFQEAAVTLFNHTATFSQHAHLALTTQHLESLQALTSQSHLVPLELKNRLRKTLAPVVYVQSDCDPPSDRDVYVAELMKHIQVDSYGQCLHNKDLPPHLRDSTAMEDEGFLHILARYKFVLAFENALCDDYVTEKLWRPLKLGVVPVYRGAPNVRRWLPSERSAVVVGAGDTPETLARHLRRLDGDDGAYASYLEWKVGRRRGVSNRALVEELRGRGWGVQDPAQGNFIDAFECMVCDRVWDNIHRKEKGLELKSWHAEANHLLCPPPKKLDYPTAPRNSTSLRGIWSPSYEQSKREAKALRRLVERNTNFTMGEYWKEVFSD